MDNDTYTRLLNEVANLPRSKLKELQQFIAALLAKPQPRLPVQVKTKGELVSTKQIGSLTIRTERRKCGSHCTCNGGKGHGPYRYAYWWQDGRVRSKYLGKP